MEQLDLFLSTYMTLGATVSIEYGWSYHQNYGSTYEAISRDIIGTFKGMQERISQGGGDYDGFVGLVSNYNFKHVGSNRQEQRGCVCSSHWQ